VRRALAESRFTGGKDRNPVYVVLTPTAPDYAAPLVGWRTWVVDSDRGRLRLRSVVKPALWQPRQAFEARCLRPRLLRNLRRHGAPDARCSCGVYAADLAVAAAYFDHPMTRGAASVQQVLGQVAVWGRVVECEQGMRGEWAYPQHLYVAVRDARGRERADAYAVAAGLEEYGVPVTVAEADEGDLLQRLVASAA
jgi:hypothetical protein